MRLWIAATLVACAGAAHAQPGRYAVSDSKYAITDAEREACQGDATAFCSMAYPDEDALLSCMKAKRPNLTQVCRTVFEAGLRRRGIPF